MSTSVRPREPAPLSCREVELSLGVLVLGALDPAERHQVEEHLAVCSRCRDSLAELAGLPGLLNRLDLTQAEAGLPSAPDRLLDAALAAAARPSSGKGSAVSRPGRLWAALAVAAAAALVATAAVLTTRAEEATPPQAGPAPSSTVGTTVLWDGASTDGAIHASVVLVPQASGSRLSMSLSGVRSGQRCDLVIESASGHREVVASWQATYDGAATVTGSTSLAPQRVNRMLVTTPEGGTLLQLWRAT